MDKLLKLQQQLASYLDANNIKLGSKTAQKTEHAFLCGARSALDQQLPLVDMCVMSGRSILSLGVGK